MLVVTYAKAGTSWMQAILGHLLLGVGSAAAARPQEVSRWLDMRSPLPVADCHAALGAQTHRRFLKTHLRRDALPPTPAGVKAIYIDRDSRDVILSMHAYHSRLAPEALAAISSLPDRVGPPLALPPADAATYWRGWMEGDGHPWWSFWDHTRTWWAARHRRDVLLLHYADMLADLPAAGRRVAAFLDLPPLSDANLATVVERCSFDYMKAHAEDVTPGGGKVLRGGAPAFMHKGTNGRWRGVLTAAEADAYEARAVAELGEACARWLKEGGAVGRV